MYAIKKTTINSNQPADPTMSNAGKSFSHGKLGFDQLVFFSFIKYSKPCWQFMLSPITDSSFPACFVDESAVQDDSLDGSYDAYISKLYDAAYRQWYGGYLTEATHQAVFERQRQYQKPPLADEYYFIKKYRGTAFCFYTLINRLLTLHNPLKESLAFKSALAKKISLQSRTSVQYQEYERYKSALVLSDPLISIIIPTLNRYAFLSDLLKDLESQSYKNFEIIIVDQSDNFKEAYYKTHNLNMSIIYQKEKLLWTARNRAILKARGEYLLFLDDDSRVGSDWIEQHLKCIDFFSAEISAGVSLSVSGGKIPESYSYFRWADQFDSGNALVKRSAFEKTGLFDEQFNNGRMGDGEFGIRAYLNGIRSISNCKASRVHLKAGEGGLRETVSWDAFRPRKLLAPKPVPSVLYLMRRYFSRDAYSECVLQGFLLSNVPYRFKRNPVMLMISTFLFLVKMPLLVYQFMLSSRRANILLKQGPRIPTLKEQES